MSSCQPHNESVGLIRLCNAPAVSRFLAFLTDETLPSVFHEHEQHHGTYHSNNFWRFVVVVDAVGERFLLAKWLKEAVAIFPSGLTEA